MGFLELGFGCVRRGVEHQVDGLRGLRKGDDFAQAGGAGEDHDDAVETERDAFYTMARVSWKPGTTNVWTLPTIYAVGPDDRVANGCRAVEALRVIYDVANLENLPGARERVRKNVLVSDIIKYPAKTGGRSEVRIEAHAEQNSVRAASEAMSASTEPPR